jgi:cyclohexyl-isocyanide hydratase
MVSRESLNVTAPLTPDGAPAPDGAAHARPKEALMSSAPFPVVFALFPKVTQLDFTGPAEVFSRLPGASLTLATVRGGVLETESGITFAGIKRLADVQECALLCVPGGYGTVDAMEDPAYLDSLRRLAAKARYITSVCTGSLLLGAAGLLRGKRAACHWAWRDLLTTFGAVPDPARVVREGNLFSGGGVTAGIDMALTVMSEIAGPDFAQAVQLGLEYAPEPPFAAGRPEVARPEIVSTVRARLDSMGANRQAAARRASAALIA